MAIGRKLWVSGVAVGVMVGALTGCGGPKQGEPSGRTLDGQVAASDSAPAPAQVAAPKGRERRILALGDSLLAGYGLRPEQAYPPRLEAALRMRGINARVVNAGVSGDTTEDGRARLAFSLGPKGSEPELVLISLGGNDMLRGLPPAKTRENLDAILTELDARHVRAVLLGMVAAPNMGRDYAAAFNPIYADLARRHHAVLVPFFLKAVYARTDLQLPDHIHPTPEGVEAMVKATQGTVVKALPPEAQGAPKA